MIDKYLALSKEDQDRYDEYQDELYKFATKVPHRPANRYEQEEFGVVFFLTKKGEEMFEAKRRELQEKLGFEEPQLTGYLVEF